MTQFTHKWTIPSAAITRLVPTTIHRETFSNATGSIRWTFGQFNIVLVMDFSIEE